MRENVTDPVHRHGPAPYRIAVLHGGPGAAGEMAPVARVLSRRGGVLEPWQTALSVDGQVAELAGWLREAATPPVACVGHSFGAWLGLLLAARHPGLVGKLILVGSGPLEARHAEGLTHTRLGRLAPGERREAEALLAAGPGLDDAGLARLGALFGRADAYDPLAPEDTPPSGPDAGVQAAIFSAVWPEAAALRQSGELLRQARSLRCPVIAIHGAHDPHPLAGVSEPLAGLAGFRCLTLPRCGHTPWLERQAREYFFEALAAALGEDAPSAGA
ncbi:MAG: alpha/beta hydrolase [Solidesulfovibrio sp.]|uniref:alpha/beta fold hydrolase n=1 Tax=Solidesulfovibrio sp. TaxID=2910990 RepID=UPI002B1EFF27|nr:alpha/beta hydrolase [Solidesulfovibrio sp.]MEA4856976.1 alpha/beta hydrolase [Solidesulfovibrio sp.]